MTYNPHYDYADASQWRGTTILTVRKNGKVVVVGDGQVSAGNTVMKSSARKVRTLAGGSVLTGFAGATADAFALLERLEAKLEAHPTQLARACVELAKDWRTDKYLRQLQAMMIVADKSETFVLTGTGDVVQPDTAETGSGITAIGSGGNYALSAALAMDEYEDDAETLARKAMGIADRICVFTNNNLTLEMLKTD
jgi:ATP-dependent HslUV protease subunit HslV